MELRTNRVAVPAGAALPLTSAFRTQIINLAVPSENAAIADTAGRSFAAVNPMFQYFARYGAVALAQLSGDLLQ